MLLPDSRPLPCLLPVNHDNQNHHYYLPFGIGFEELMRVILEWWRDGALVDVVVETFKVVNEIAADEMNVL